MTGSRLLWAIVLGFLCGVAMRSFMLIGIAEIFFMVLLASVFAAFSIRNAGLRERMILCTCVALCAALGVWRMDAARFLLDENMRRALATQVQIIGAVIAEPDEREGTEHLTVEAHSIIKDTQLIPVSGRVLAFVPPHTRVAYGDEVRVSGILALPQDFEVAPGRSFDYPGYLAVSGVSVELMRAQAEATGVHHTNVFIESALALKHAYLDGLASVLPQPESGLAGGITVGDKRSVGDDLSGAFQRAGLVHILVLSGYNITVVASALARILSSAPKVFGYFGGFVTIAFFMVASGGASSAVRSGILAGVGMIARITHRRVHAGNALLAAAFVMVVWNPYILVFDPSFQYAMLAAVGIVYVAPLLEKKWQFIPTLFGIREVLVATLATQLTVVPLMVYQSGAFGIYALPANILVLVTVPLAMFFSALAGIAGMIVGSYAVPLAAPAYMLLLYIVTVTSACASLPFAWLTIPPIPAWVVWCVYGTLTFLLIAVTQKNRRTECGGSSRPSEFEI